MKKTHSLFLLISGFFIFFLSSCMDDRYDLDDENLDKNAVFSPNGIDIPVGSMERISIAEELRKNFNGEILGTGDETLYVKYGSAFPVNFIHYEIPPIDQVTTNPSPIELSGSVVITQSLNLVSNEVVTYKVNDPVFDKEGWEIDLKQVNFAASTIDVHFNLSNLDFGTIGEANIILTLDFPSGFVLANSTNRIEKTINISDLDNGSYTIEGIQVEAYNYTVGEENLTYSVDLDVLSSIEVTANAPTFQLTLDNSSLLVESLVCSINGQERIEDQIEGFGDFYNAFAGNTFEFRDPSLFLSVQTNLGCNFALDVDQIYTNTANVALESPLVFEKPLPIGSQSPKFTSYLLSPNAPNPLPANVNEWRNFDLNELISSVPTELNYDITLNFEDDDAVIFYQAMALDAVYELKLPFDFNYVNLNVYSFIHHFFSEDLYDQLFKYAEGNISIQADSINVAVGEEIGVTVHANIFDENNQNLGVNIDPIELNRGFNSNFSLEIKKEDMEKMKDAKHLEFVFSLGGKGSVTGNDYIDIQKVRLITDGGIHFEF